jgi:glutathione S-transferase
VHVTLLICINRNIKRKIHARVTSSERIPFAPYHRWLLEELGLDYQVIIYERDPKTRFAPPELKAIHPLGKAPVLKDGDQVLIESGAIIEYLIQRYGKGALVPAAGTAAYYQYLQWMHYAEGSAARRYCCVCMSANSVKGAPLHPRIHSELANHLGYMEQSLEGKTWFCGDEITGADIQLSFVAQIAVRTGGKDMYPNLARFVAALEARPAYQRAVARYGENRIVNFRLHCAGAMPAAPASPTRAEGHPAKWRYGAKPAYALSASRYKLPLNNRMPASISQAVL